jgi:hypothetical protein
MAGVRRLHPRKAAADNGGHDSPPAIRCGKSNLGAPIAIAAYCSKACQEQRGRGRQPPPGLRPLVTTPDRARLRRCRPKHDRCGPVLWRRHAERRNRFNKRIENIGILREALIIGSTQERNVGNGVDEIAARQYALHVRSVQLKPALSLTSLDPIFVQLGHERHLRARPLEQGQQAIGALFFKTIRARGRQQRHSAQPLRRNAPCLGQQSHGPRQRRPRPSALAFRRAGRAVWLRKMCLV